MDSWFSLSTDLLVCPHMPEPRSAQRLSNASLENPSWSLSDPATWEGILTPGPTSSGVAVNERIAMGVAPVWQAVSLISGHWAGAPLNVYRRTANDDRELDTSHPASFLLTGKANRYTTAFQVRRAAAVHALLWNNGYIFIDWANNQKPVGLYNLLPDRTSCEWHNGRKMFVTEVNIDGRPKLETLEDWEVLHWRGVSIDGMEGLKLIQTARDSIGLALANIGFGAKFYKNGARVGGVLELPREMTKAARDTAAEGFEKTYREPFKTVILRDGAKFHAAQMSPEQAQMVEAREADARAVARFFNLPPSKLGIQGSVSYGSNEESNRAYLTDCLWPWLVTESSEADAKLLTEQQQRTRSHYTEHNTSKLIEGDSLKQAQYLEIMRRNEVISANEWRRKVNMNRRDDAGGDEYGNPNVKSGGPAPTPEQPPGNLTAAVAKNMRQAHCAATAYVSNLAKRLARNRGKFVEWLDSDWSGVRADYASRMNMAAELHEALAGVAAGATAEAEATAATADIHNRLKAILEPPYKDSELAANVEKVFAKLTEEFSHADGGE